MRHFAASGAVLLAAIVSLSVSAANAQSTGGGGGTPIGGGNTPGPQTTTGTGSLPGAQNVLGTANAAIGEATSLAPGAGYEPLGVHLGSFFVYPGFDAALGSTSNIFSASNAQSDTFALLSPFVTVSSDWGRNALNFDLRTVSLLYSKFSSENTTSAFATADGRLDVSHDADLFGSLRLSDAYEPRSVAPQQFLLAKPTEYTEAFGLGGGEWTRNRYRFILQATFDDLRYMSNRVVNGPVFSEADRDHTDYTYTARSEYTISPATWLFVEATGNVHDYELRPPQVTVDRNATGYTLLTGARWDLTRLLTGQIGVGYLNENYKQKGFSSTSGLALNTNLNWNITPLITLTGVALRQVNDAGVQGASSYITTSGGLGATYEWRRNVAFALNGSYAKDDYNGVQRQDTRWQFGGTADWRLNRLLSAYGQVTYQNQDSTGAAAGRDFDDTIVLVGLRVKR